jgi:hypothetical protein
MSESNIKDEMNIQKARQTGFYLHPLGYFGTQEHPKIRTENPFPFFGHDIYPTLY